MLNNTQIKNIQNANYIIFTTCDKNLSPRSIAVIPSKIEHDKIIISKIQMEKTYSNILENPKCFINVCIPEQNDLQYKIEGVANIYDSGNLFNEIKDYEESNNLPPELKVSAIIVVNITNIQESNG